MPSNKINRNASPFLALSTEQVLSRLAGPLDSVRGLPNEAFTSQSFFELERETVFAGGWSFAGRSSDVLDSGDMVPVTAAG